MWTDRPSQLRTAELVWCRYLSNSENFALASPGSHPSSADPTARIGDVEAATSCL